MMQFLVGLGVISGWFLLGMLAIGITYRIKPKWSKLQSHDTLDSGDLFWASMLTPLLLLIGMCMIVSYYTGGIFKGYLAWVNHETKRGKDISA